MSIRCFDSHSTDPFYNLAFEEYLLEEIREKELMMLWQNDRTVVIGRNQIAEDEVDLGYARENGIYVVRRNSGGGAVYHDLGNLNYSFICDAEENASEKFLNRLVCVLGDAGIPALCSGRNDILVNGKKISGTAKWVSGGRVLFHGTLLYETDRDTMNRVLKVSAEKLKKHAVRSVHSRVGSIKEICPEVSSVEKLKQRICEGFRLDEPEKADAEALKMIQDLADKKYRCAEWNFPVLFRTCYTAEKSYAGGNISVRFSLENGRMRNISFFGDYLSSADTAAAGKMMEGCLYDAGAVLDRLQWIDLPLYFGQIKAEEIAELFFDGKE